MTEDEVRDKAKIILKFDEQEKDVTQGTGQLTTFNQLGIKGEGKDKKPDGWYLPKDKNSVAIILETKNSNENFGKKATLEEIKRNCQIVMDAGFQYVVGILYNGEKTLGFINNIELDIPKDLQEKSFYFNLVKDKSINRRMIYLLTAKINNCLHTEFGITDLYKRMIFTAGALVAERYGAKLSGMKDRGFDTFHDAIINTLKNALKTDLQKNQKIALLIDVYSEIQMNSTKNQEAINNFINCVIEISRCIHSNRWHGEDVMGIFFNEFNRYKKKASIGQVFTPDHITSFMYRLINITKDDYVGDFACGSGAFLVKAMSNMIEEVGNGNKEVGEGTKEAKEICQNHLFGIEWHREIYALACANMLIHKDGKTNLEQLDTRQQEACDWIKSKPITKVLMNPPFETKYGCVEIVKNVLDNVKKDTECAFIMPDKKLEKSSKKLVSGILEKHRLTTIVKLPEDLFFGVGVTTSIFVFKAGNPQKDEEIFGVYIENDGLQTVKNQGRHDVKNLWGEIEDYWIDAIKKRNDEKYKTHQWIKPAEHLSYQMPEKPFEIYEEDFFKTALDYEMYKRGIDATVLSEELLKKVLYASEISTDGDDIVIRIKGGKKKLIDAGAWGKFKIGDLFEKCELKCLKTPFNKASDVSLIRNEEFNLPLVNAKHFNNGIMYYGREEDWQAEEMTIDIVEDGAASTGDVYAQPQKTGVLYNAYLVKLNEEVAAETLKYLATIIQCCVKKHFGYDNKCTWNKVKAETISLPAIADAPDYAFMENYMQTVDARAKMNLPLLTSAQKSLPKKIDVSNWKEFKIGELFDIVKGKRLTKAQMKEGSTNFVGSSSFNNGVTCHIGNKENIHNGNLITVAYNGSVGETFYHESEFIASDDVNVLYPKFKMNKYNAKFFCPIIKSVGKSFAFIDKWKREDMEVTYISLPVTKDGDPDYDYMEKFMRTIEEKAALAAKNMVKANS